MRRILITGIGGFVGSHLAEYLCDRYEVWGLDLKGNPENVSGFSSKVNVMECDLLKSEKVIEAIGGIRPVCIFHLAAQSSPALSFSIPEETIRNNVFSTLNLLEAVSKVLPETIIVNVGSGDEYGYAEAGKLPVKETSELRPVNPYAVSKVAQDMLGFQYWKTKGLKVVRCRPFNFFGPRQSENFVTASFAKQIALVEEGEEKVLKTGNLEAAKDFLYVKDAVTAYETLMEKGVPGEVYNISSGSAVKIGRILEVLLSFSWKEITVVEDPGRFRPGDTVAIYGDSTKLKRLGWSPEYGLEDGLRELLEYWRLKVKKGAVA